MNIAKVMKGITLMSKSTIELAREANIVPYIIGPTNSEYLERLKAFEDLVAQQATEEANRRANASWTLLWEKMLAAEREACARIVEESSLPDSYSESCLPEIANEIRARGNNHEF